MTLRDVRSSLKTLKHVPNGNKNIAKATNTFFNDYVWVRNHNFESDPLDPRVIDRAFRRDPGGIEALAIASPKFVVYLYTYVFIYIYIHIYIYKYICIYVYFFYFV